MYIDGREQAIIALGVCATVAISIVSIGKAYVRSIEANRKASRPDVSPDVQERMSRIEQAVDAIAIEVERMSEGQRFTTRLLTEQFGDRGRPASAAQLPTRRPDADGANGAGGNYGR